MYYVLFYDFVDDILNLRTPYRAEHIARAKAAYDEGFLVMAGAFNPPEGSAMVFRADDRAQVEEFANNDPYVANGLVPDWKIREWTVVIPSE